ncbi:tRNA (Ile)-lysidine synthase [Gossypium arboreum]|uniref:tRNA (Ile)-lysidine synthase n=1 Tax=Gossypium arboreum TaxID=29729 RepID=A0A0B0PIK1_GOSAR|nr:tRNA (Ile)-lysidine synthase [Gossypium arboreum]
MLLIGCLMFKLVLSDITWLDRNMKRHIILVDKPKHVRSLIRKRKLVERIICHLSGQLIRNRKLVHWVYNFCGM